jgi:C1A family cysteine protease
MLLRRPIAVLMTLALAACSATPAPAPSSAEAQPRSAQPQSEAALPSRVDLRPILAEWNLPPRPQGHRGTCSIFTTCEAIEFAHAKSTGNPQRLSPEFVNWAASQAAGGPSDGNFFFNAVAGYEKHGVCTEAAMPYRKSFDAKQGPSKEATAEAAALRDRSKDTLAVRWIQPWKPNVMGVSEESLQEMKRVIAAGYPVAAGSGHSRLFVGYHDNPDLAGGGAFITEDSALNRYDEVTYRWVRDNVADAFWIEALPAKP